MQNPQRKKIKFAGIFSSFFLPISMQHPVKKTNFFVRIFSIIYFHAESTFTVLIFYLFTQSHIAAIYAITAVGIGIILYVQYTVYCSIENVQ